jgi:hypothetical protein
MATIGAIAIKRALAEDRLSAAMQRIGSQLKVDPAVIPARKKYSPDFNRAITLEALADWAEKIADAVAPQTPSDEITQQDGSGQLDEMTVAELKRLAESAGLNVAELKRKADYVQALEDYNASLYPASPEESDNA